MEVQELKVTVEALRKENAQLRKTNVAREQEFITTTNRLTRVESRQNYSRNALTADDEEVRSANEWKAFLLSALKILSEVEEEKRVLQERLRLLLHSVQKTMESIKKVDPTQRASLEREIRQSQEILFKEEERLPTFVPEPQASTLSKVKVLGVQLNLGVVALAAGHQQGARVGMPFLVVRDKKAVAILTLVEVREATALALIEKMDSEVPIREGDIAVLRKLWSN